MGCGSHSLEYLSHTCSSKLLLSSVNHSYSPGCETLHFLLPSLTTSPSSSSPSPPFPPFPFLFFSPSLPSPLSPFLPSLCPSFLCLCFGPIALSCAFKDVKGTFHHVQDKIQSSPTACRAPCDLQPFLPDLVHPPSSIPSQSKSSSHQRLFSLKYPS